VAIALFLSLAMIFLFVKEGCTSLKQLHVCWKKIEKAVLHMFQNDTGEGGGDIVNPIYFKKLNHFPDCSDFLTNIEIGTHLTTLLLSFRDIVTAGPAQILHYESSSLPIGCILESEASVIFLFRGTSTGLEMERNLQFHQTENGLHSGFQAIFDVLVPQIEHFMQSRSHERLEEKHVFVAGHSLGGTQATLLSRYLWHQWPWASSSSSSSKHPRIQTWCFGTPRIASPRWCRQFENMRQIAYYNVTNQDDIFTSVPLSVTPNLRCPSQPFLYDHPQPQLLFSFNGGSVTQNHDLHSYQSYLKFLPFY